ncbi:MAG TPA: hypothetical protein VF614_03310, partial [Chthoniobacteraceae bacterium]
TQIIRKRCSGAAEMRGIDGQLRQVFPFGRLPEDYRYELDALRMRNQARSFTELLDMQRVETRWVPDRPWLSYPPTARETATKRRLVMEVYYKAVALGIIKERAKELAIQEHLRQFGEACTEKWVRRWEKTIEKRGGFDHAPDVAYCDGKSCDHVRARLDYKLGLCDEFKAEWERRCTTCEHLQGAYSSLVLDWLAEREIKGLGVRESDAPFPFTFEQLRPFAPSTAARRLGSHGKARVSRECVRYVHTTATNLRRCEYLLLDDTRIDIIAASDRTGFPVELKAYVLMDGASRQILGYIVKESEALMAEDVWALLSQVLAKTGLPVGYPIHLKFERGAVACSAATETLLKSLWRGRIEIHRTSMEGGRNNAADFFQQASGHWMGKSHIESFMRTLAFRLEHIAGQRGGDYRRQPAQLGLVGKNRKAGLLEYTNGSQIQESVRSELCARVLNYIETGDVNAARNQKVEFTDGDRRLKPVRWARDAIREAVAFYNGLPSRAEGFAQMEVQCPQTGRLITRRESPNERAAVLSAAARFEAIRAEDAAALLRWRGRAVMVTPQGVTISCHPWKNLNFYREHSPVIEEVKRLATQKRKLVALIDEETLRRWNPETDDWTPEIHLIGDVTADAWKPGMEGRYLDTLPLEGPADRTDIDEMNSATAVAKRDLARAQAELLHASRGVLPTHLARALQEQRELEGASQGMALAVHRFEDEAPASDLVIAAKAGEGQSRAAQQAEAAPAYAAGLQFEAAQDNEF